MVWEIGCHLKKFKMVVILDRISELKAFSKSESSVPMLPIQFQFNTIWVREEMSIEEFKDGCQKGYLGYQNEGFLKFGTSMLPPIPPTKLWFNPTYSSEDVL